MQAGMPYYAATSYVLRALYPIYFKTREAKLPAINCAARRIA